MALTKAQKITIGQALAADAHRRGIDHTKLSQELFELLLASRATQKAELQRMVSRLQLDRQETLAEFDVDKATQRAKLEDETAQMAALLAELDSL